MFLIVVVMYICSNCSSLSISSAAPKEHLAEFISSLHGRVAYLLRHMVGSLGIMAQL